MLATWGTSTGFNPATLFAGGVQGAWYDPSDNTTMFQDAAGTTPVTAVEQAVGLIFDKSKGTPTARYNFLTYSEQFDDAAWTKANLNTTGTPVWVDAAVAPDGTTTADALIPNTSNTEHNVVQSYSFIANTVVTISIYVKANGYTFFQIVQGIDTAFVNFDVTPGSGSVTLTSGTSMSGSIVDAGNGWYRCVVVFNPSYSSTQPIRFGSIGSGTAGRRAAFAGNGTSGLFIWGAQVQTGSSATAYQKIVSGIGGEWTPGNHAYQSTDASRPTLRARYNLLTYSEEFENAAWVKFQSTVTQNVAVAPNGTTTADKLFGNAGSTSPFAYIGASTISGAQYVASVYVKAAEFGFAWVVCNVRASSTTTGVCINLSTGALTNGGANGTYAVTDAGNGWWRVSCTATASTTVGYLEIGPRSTAGAGYQAGNGADGILVWGAQLVPTAVFPSNTYQRIAAATDYATGAAFPQYLSFDGTDDSLLTASVDFSGTDKMTVWSGVTKLSGTTGVITELSTNVQLDNGSFVLGSAFVSAVTYDVQVRGTDRNARSYSTYTAPVTNVLQTSITTTAADSSAAMQTRVNGVVNAGSNFLSVVSTGNFGNYPLYIGRRNNASLPFNGRIYQLIVRGAASNTTQVAQTEKWVASKTPLWSVP